MHSISPYMLRCFNQNLPGKGNDKYSPLDKVGKYDTFHLLKSFIEAKQDNFKIVEDSKQVFRFQGMEYDEKKREIFGWFQVGSYGIKTDIINIDNGEVDFEKAQNNAEIIRHYIHFFIPNKFNEGIAILHAYRGNGVKTLFYNLFKPYFNQYTNLNIQMNPLSYDKAMASWQDANAKELKVTKFVGLTDIADQLRNLGHKEQELIIKPPRNGALGKLKDYFNKDSEQAKAVEVLSPLGSQVKTVVEINGKRRTFRVGQFDYNTLCEIELDDEVKLIDGNPELTSMHKWCKTILQEYSITMYPNMNVVS
ncbi:MAG: hypothetical protein ABW079_06705 [Sedimenticola sp.]